MLSGSEPGDGHEAAGPGTNRRELLKRAAIVGGAVWVPPFVQSVTAPASADARSPIETRSCGRMTGGGVIAGVGGRTRYGFELHCDTSERPNHLEVAFVHDGRQLNFHLDTLTSVTCSDERGPEPAPPDADFDTMAGTGTGHLSGPRAACRQSDSATITFRLVDGGEPGGADFVEFHISCGGTALLDVEGTPSGGNRQAHEASGRKACH